MYSIINFLDLMVIITPLVKFAMAWCGGKTYL